MFHSIREYISDGVNKNFQANFDLGYIAQEHVHVYWAVPATGVTPPTFTEIPSTDYTWVDATHIELDVARPSGNIIKLQRLTPSDELLVDFTNGSIVSDSNLDTAQLQSLMVAQEAQDAAQIAGDLAVDGAEISESVVDTANDALAAATAAQATAAAAQSTANTALSTANSADAKAQLALDTVQAAGVQSFNGRTGTVVPAAGDYSASQITYGVTDVGSELTSLAAAIATANGNLSAFQTALAAATSSDVNGAKLVGWKAVGAGAVARTLDAELKDQWVNVRSFGAVGNGVADDAPAFRAALTACPYGGTVFIPAGIYLLNSIAGGVGTGVLDWSNFPNKGVTFRGVGWSLKSGGSFSFGSGTGPVGSILRMGPSIPSTSDIFHLTPIDLVVGGVGFRDFAVTAFTGAYGDAYGRHVFNFNGSGAADGYIENLLMENVFADNTAAGYSINVNAAGNAHGVHAGAVIRNCKLMSINAPNWGDSNNVEYCTFGANAILDSRNVGIYFYNVSGATSIRILNNNFVNANGMIICDGATKPLIVGNEMEQSLTNSAGILLWMRGNAAPVDNPTIADNAIAQNVVGQSYTPIFISQSLHARVSANRISTLTDYPHIQIAASSSHTLIEADNQPWVNGVATSSMSVLDAGTKSLLRGQVWTPFTTTISASSGAFTTVSAVSGYTLIDARTVALRWDVTITDAGTAAGNLRVTLPTGFVSAFHQSVAGQEINLTGKAVAGFVAGAGSIVSVSEATGVTIIATGRRVIFSAVMQIQ